MKTQNMPLGCALVGLAVLGLIFRVGASEVRKTGSTRADDDLYRNAAHDLMARARLNKHCSRVDAFHTEELNEIVPGSAEGNNYAFQYGSVIERWTVSLCNTQLTYRVTFTGDGVGSTFFSAVQE